MTGSTSAGTARSTAARALVTLNRTDDNFDVGTRVKCPSTVTNNVSSGNFVNYVFDGAGCITSNNQ